MADTLREKILEATDFGQLRESGIRLFEWLTGKIWTDYNTHDPGVTILENCLYALTESAHKAELPIEALLQGVAGTNASLFPAATSLYNAPLTIDDLRKILIDIYGVSNSWFAKQEYPAPLLYKDSTTGALNMTAGNLFAVKGLWDVFIELSSSELKILDPTLDFSDIELNGNVLRSVTPASLPAPGGGNESFFVEFAFPYWESFPVDWQLPVIINSITINGGSPAGIVYNPSDDAFTASLDVLYNTTKVFSLGVIVKMTPFFTNTVTTNNKQLHIGSLLVASLFQRLNKKIITIGKAISGIHNVLHENRTMATVFNSVDAARMQEIVIKADIKVKESENAEALVTDFFLNLDKFLSPLPESYSRDELTAMGKTFEQIYNGPLLNNGFLLDASLTDVTTNTVLFASDLIHAMTGMANKTIPPSYKLLSFSMTSYLNNYVISGPSDDKLIVANSDRYRPRLSVIKSNIRVFKEGSLAEIQYDKDKVIADFLTLNVRRIKRISLSHDETVGSLEKNPLTDHQYYSIQNDFPIVYGVGRGTLSLSAPPDRVAKSRQLKAYLLFFEQIIANHQQHISSLHRSLSLDRDLDVMNPALPLYDVPEVAPLLLAFLSSGTSFTDFIKDPSNGYATAVRNLSEGTALFFQRRNRFLDHLLARFGEDLSGYTKLMITKNYHDPAQIDPAKSTPEWKIIQDKLTMLSEVPFLEGNRSLGPNFTQFILLNEPITGQWRWEIRDASAGTVLLVRSTSLGDPVACFNDLMSILDTLIQHDCYRISTVAPFSVSFVEHPPAGAVVGISPATFPNVTEAEAHIQKIISLCSLLWNTDNVSGLEKKVARKIGIENYSLRNLVNLQPDYPFIYNFSGGQFIFTITIDDIPEPLVSIPAFASLVNARSGAGQTIIAAADPTNYVTAEAGGFIDITISDLTGDLAVMHVATRPQAEIKKLIEKIAVFFRRNFGSQEGFYLIEHITSLPKLFTTTGILDTTVFDEDVDNPVDDPYSYKISVIIPDGTDPGLLTAAFQNRLTDADFRTLLEKQFQQECLAHVLPYFIYPDATEMQAFQVRFKRWRVWKHLINGNMNVLNPILQDIATWLNSTTPKLPLYLN
jgi:hypothetical protein